jgi:hypothetical protein
VNEVNEATVNEVKATLEAPGKPKTKGAKKVAKKVKKTEAEQAEAPKGKKKVAEKTNGKSNHGESDGLITVAQLAEEAEISPQSARVKLRAAELDRGEGRWKWEPGSKALKAARKVLGLEG